MDSSFQKLSTMLEEGPSTPDIGSENVNSPSSTASQTPRLRDKMPPSVFDHDSASEDSKLTTRPANEFVGSSDSPSTTDRTEMTPFEADEASFGGLNISGLDTSNRPQARAESPHLYSVDSKGSPRPKGSKAKSNRDDSEESNETPKTRRMLKKLTIHRTSPSIGSPAQESTCSPKMSQTPPFTPKMSPHKFSLTTPPSSPFHKTPTKVKKALISAPVDIRSPHRIPLAKVRSLNVQVAIEVFNTIPKVFKSGFGPEYANINYDGPWHLKHLNHGFCWNKKNAWCAQCPAVVNGLPVEPRFQNESAISSSKLASQPLPHGSLRCTVCGEACCTMVDLLGRYHGTHPSSTMTEGVDVDDDSKLANASEEANASATATPATTPNMAPEWPFTSTPSSATSTTVVATLPPSSPFTTAQNIPLPPSPFTHQAPQSEEMFRLEALQAIDILNQSMGSHGRDVQRTMMRCTDCGQIVCPEHSRRCVEPMCAVLVCEPCGLKENDGVHWNRAYLWGTKYVPWAFRCDWHDIKMEDEVQTMPRDEVAGVDSYKC